MTKRIDILDDALLRPGRFELLLKISLPDKEGRVQIFMIHTKHLYETNKIEKNIDIELLANNIKNFTGAEIQG